MYELIDPEFVTSQKITNIFKNAYIDIKEAQYLSDSDSYYWMIELNSEGVLIGLDPKEKQFDIGENTALCTYNEFENNERFILNLINEMNKRFNIRSYIRLDKEQSICVFSARAVYRYGKGFNPADFIDECRFFAGAYRHMLSNYLVPKFKQEGILND
ncbi:MULTISPECIES: hypothetical protein [unclassified Neisseria]|jgi:hypothetical protein|uniref:hypothetical protein n=1 Tax=unclassified Neisseria TaxID=2623750 RepID=UPI00022BF02B|nr:MULTISPECIES: hypothetical protein [unclassified Neisseria]EGY60624.1 hypothetical protein HMPREF1028_01340 [Neisseria sp. GT4A_CT1]OFM05011.1 hypothetical protein HMPREF2726_11460 [Neisseria sp. HMSC074B07]